MYYELVRQAPIKLSGDLTMFNGLSSIHRLLLCLLLSASVHGGLVLYDGVLSPAESRHVRAPVEVSLLPIVDIAAPALEEKSQALLETVTSNSTPRVVAAKQTRVDQQTKSLASKVIATKALPTKPPLAPRSPLLAIAADEPLKEIVPVELTCAAPQGVIHETHTELSESLAELFADSKPGSGLSRFDTALTEPDTVIDKASTGKQQASLRAVDKGGLPISVTQSLIEAFPNYRSNPLPKYPQMARQKRWQGVVWLLVDVSAEGLVDDLQVEQSCGYRVLDRAASQAVRRWEFSPARRAGLVVESQVRIPVRFRLEDG